MSDQCFELWSLAADVAEPGESPGKQGKLCHEIFQAALFEYSRRVLFAGMEWGNCDLVLEAFFCSEHISLSCP